MKNIQVNFWCTDNWKAFKEVFHSDYHLVGKKFTKAIEGVNTSLRNSCKRLIRKTTAFSKKLLNHWCAVKLAMYHRNLNLSYI
jgi:IS1 family transposase